MKKYTQKWKTLNKNGLKLSLICGLNWLIKIVFKGQFYLFSAVFCGLLTYYMPQDIQFFTLRVLEFIVIVKIVIDTIQVVLSGRLKKMRLALLIGLMYLSFLAGNSYINENILTEAMVHRLFSFWCTSGVIAGIVMLVQPRLFRSFLFKNVINKNYLGIRKLTDDLPPKSNIYVDAEEVDADKRMRLINQNVIKPPYQDAVELSYLNREIITAIHHEVTPFGEENKRTFVDYDTIYFPTFTVHPFGDYEGKFDFHHRLIPFRLSQKEAFSTIGVRNF